MAIAPERGRCRVPAYGSIAARADRVDKWIEERKNRREEDSMAAVVTEANEA